MTTASEDWVIEAYQQIMRDRRDPIDVRYEHREVERVRDPVAYEERQLRVEQLRQLQAEAEEDNRVTARCPYCGADVPFVADGENDCPSCGKELGVDLDPGMYEPSRLPLTTAHGPT